jgi:stage IV sporulation protein FB
MAWQDRPYYRDRSASPHSRLLWLLTGSVPLFTVFNIRVRVHASFILFVLIELLLAPTSYGLGPFNAVVSLVILFGSVLLHEFGHCFGSRYVGGDPDEILLWPLGGLASANPPHRPWASFFTTACGPLVNLLLCVLTGGAIIAIRGSFAALPWLEPLTGRLHIPASPVTYYLWWIYFVNYSLFLFNIAMVFYPFDGGRMIQELLWVKIGHYRSMLIATVVGMAGALVIAGAGIAFRSFSLVLLAGFGFFYCFRDRQALRETGPDEAWQESNSIDFSAAYEPHTSSKPKRRKVSSRRLKKARRLAQLAADEQTRVDGILSKVSARGMASLSWSERRALRKATEHQRQRDLQVTPSVRR